MSWWDERVAMSEAVVRAGADGPQLDKPGRGRRRGYLRRVDRYDQRRRGRRRRRNKSIKRLQMVVPLGIQRRELGRQRLSLQRLKCGEQRDMRRDDEDD
jgi:hypothetical protein